MRLRQQRLHLPLLLFRIIPLIHAHVTLEHVADLAEGKALRDPQSKQGPNPTPAASLLAKPTSPIVIGTHDAPVDGKDGRPHEGPFVETAAERDRKKAKGSGDEEAPLTSKKPAPKAAPKGTSHSEGWDSALPESNDGVMDDPNRVGPAEGTRGTEGGISEKNRDRKAQAGQDGTKSEKTPEKPKEAPPLPHSEQEKLAHKEVKESHEPDKNLGKEDVEKLKTAEKEIGGLEVCDTVLMGCRQTSC